MKTAVVYFSLEGNTKHTAKKIAEKIVADLIELRPVHPYPTGNFAKYFHGGKSSAFKEKPALAKYEFNADEYDTVVIGTPLWAWNITPPVRTFLSENKLDGKRVAAFVCSGGGKPDKAFAAIKEATGHDALTAQIAVTNALKDKDLDREIEEFIKNLK